MFTQFILLLTLQLLVLLQVNSQGYLNKKTLLKDSVRKNTVKFGSDFFQSEPFLFHDLMNRSMIRSQTGSDIFFRTLLKD
jgi:hypothetical protein